MYEFTLSIQKKHDGMHACHDIDMLPTRADMGPDHPYVCPIDNDMIRKLEWVNSIERKGKPARLTLLWMENCNLLVVQKISYL